MNAAFWTAFFNDSRTQTVLVLIVLDLLLGVIVALKNRDFRLSFIADFARNDILGKVLPFAVIYAGYKYASSTDLVIPGVDLQVVMNGAWVIVLAALVGSLLGSIKGLGLGVLPDAIAGPDPATPMTDTPKNP